MKTKLIFMFALLSVSDSFALEIPVGKYELVGQKCTSGKDAAPIAPSEMMETSMTATLDVKSTELTVDANIKYKMVGEFGKIAQANYEDAIAELESQPPSPQRDSELAMVKSILEEVKEMIAGTSCNLQLVNSISLTENILTSEIKSATTNCKQMVTEEMIGTKKIQIVKFEDGLLKFETSANSPDARSEQCDFSNDDRIVEIYKKVE